MVVKIIGPTVYRIADSTNPRKKKVVHFNRLERVPIGKVPELANGEDMVEGARNDILPVGPVPGNRNENDLVEDSLKCLGHLKRFPLLQWPKCQGNLPLQLFCGLPDK